MIEAPNGLIRAGYLGVINGVVEAAPGIHLDEERT